MLSTKEKGLLLNIIKHCKIINTKINGLSKDQFIDNEDIIQIVCFNILQIGELAKNFDKYFIEKHNAIPWRQIKGMRDKVAHGYGTIDLDRVWDTALKNINPLLNYCEQILKEN